MSCNILKQILQHSAAMAWNWHLQFWEAPQHCEIFVCCGFLPVPSKVEHSLVDVFGQDCQSDLMTQKLWFKLLPADVLSANHMDLVSIRKLVHVRSVDRILWIPCCDYRLIEDGHILQGKFWLLIVRTLRCSATTTIQDEKGIQVSCSESVMISSPSGVLMASKIQKSDLEMIMMPGCEHLHAKQWLPLPHNMPVVNPEGQQGFVWLLSWFSSNNF